MSARTTLPFRHGADEEPQFPAYGPVEAVLGYALFYVLVDRATPTVVEVFGEAVLDLSPAVLRFGMAAALWFVLVVSAVDQGRRQLAALGLVTGDESRLRVWSRVAPSSVRVAGYLLALVVGSVVAALTFDRALETAVSLIPVVATLDVAAFDVGSFLVMVVFFVAYGVATHALDRVVVDGIRALVSD